MSRRREPRRTANPSPQKILLQMYGALLEAFGPQGWWPGETRFEVIVGAILTQNTAWTNVEKTIARLKEADLLTPQGLMHVPLRDLAPLLKSSGYFNIKAERLKSFMAFFFKRTGGNLDLLFREELSILRRDLLQVCGIGPETADSILLYAGHYPVFVVDAYTRRVFSRHGLVAEDVGYEELQQLFMRHLPTDGNLFNEYHALIVRVGKEYCRPRDPRCESCPLNSCLPSFASPR